MTVPGAAAPLVQVSGVPQDNDGAVCRTSVRALAQPGLAAATRTINCHRVDIFYDMFHLNSIGGEFVARTLIKMGFGQRSVSRLG